MIHRTKACTRCHEKKALDQFNKNRRSKDYHSWECRQCQSVSKRKTAKPKIAKIKPPTLQDWEAQEATPVHKVISHKGLWSGPGW